jgi:hypothetical protein
MATTIRHDNARHIEEDSLIGIAEFLHAGMLASRLGSFHGRSITPRVQDMAGASEWDTGGLQVRNRFDDVAVAHVAIRVVVLIDEQDSSVLRIVLVQLHEIVGVFGKLDERMIRGKAKMRLVLPARQTSLTRCGYLVAGRFEQAGKVLGVSAVIQIDFLGQETILAR